jgi:cysteine-rich repeat protein
VTPLPPPAPTPPVEGGGLVRRGVLSPRLGTPAMRGPETVGMPSDGRHVYVGSAFGTLLGLQRRASDGKLHPVEAFSPVAGADPPSVPQQTLYVTFTADGTQLYLADRDGLRVYDRNVATGLLTVVQVVEETPFGDDIRSMQVALSPDETNLYVANEAHDSVVTYARNASTGELGFLQELVNRSSIGAGGVPIRGLRRPVGVVVSPDGAFVYVVSGSSSDSGQAIVVFARNPGDGTLSHVESVRQGAGIVGLSLPESIAMSPDGQNLYVTSHDEDLVSVWTRDAGTGHPTLLETHGPKTGIANLRGPHGVTVTPDGTRVYVAGTHASALLIFDRDAATGALAYVGDVVEGVNGVSGLVNVSRIAVSADGRSIYTTSPGFLRGSSFFEGTSLDQGAIVHFERDACGNGVLSSLEQCDDGNATSGDGCSDACRLELCPPLPRPDCRHPVKARGARVQMKRGATADRDQLQWAWKKGAVTTPADFGDPSTSAAYLLCLYRDAPTPELAATLAAPAGGSCDGVPCWQAKSGGAKLAYDDDLATPDGIGSLTLRAGLAAGKSSIALKAKGHALLLPSLPLQLPVTVQLTNSDTGVCWEGRYTTASKNDALQFKASGE